MAGITVVGTTAGITVSTVVGTTVGIMVSTVVGTTVGIMVSTVVGIITPPCFSIVCHSDSEVTTAGIVSSSER